ncbi:MAG: hypothetical protein ACHQIG_01590 [Acidimicrobiia bacterium]
MNTRRGPSRLVKTAVLLFVIAVCMPAVLAGAGYAATASDTKVTVKPPPGAAKPVPGSGMGTQAAMSNSRCNTDARFGVYGRWNTALVGAGPACVRPFADGEKNGGATASGVTATSVKVVAVMPSPADLTAQNKAAPSIYIGDSSTSTMENAVHDYLFANKDFYEQWGRSIDVTFYTSTGTDEAAQRADFVAIKAMKPFAVINFDSFGNDTLMNQLAKDKILVNSYLTSKAESEAVAPYRWMSGSDADAAAANSAEVIGKNLVGKKAAYGGADVKDQTRKFGLVTVKDMFDVNSFEKLLGKYKGTIASTATYPGQGDAFGDPAVAQEQAPTIVSKMKADGVTTVVLFADRAMNVALMAQADQQNWTPEWFFTGSGYSDLPVLASAQSKTQSEHAFGISLIGPYFATPPDLVDVYPPNGSYNWFWGKGVGTTSGVVPAGLGWLLSGMHYAGPDLTVKNFAQGLFSAPPVGGDPKNPLAILSGYGRTTGLPYDAYTPGPADFAPFFMDPHTTAISPGSGSSVDHASFYPNDARRYHAGEWPKNIPWFDKSVSITERHEYPVGAVKPTAGPPCAANQCPATGATTPKPGASANSTFTVPPTPAAISTT